MNDDDSLNRKSGQNKLRNGDTLKSTTNSTQLNDLETEDALKEFAFLSNESSTSSGSESDASDWSVNKAQLIKLTEEYKKEKKSSKSAKQQQQQQQQQQMLNSTNASQRPNRAALQAMIANLNESNEQDSNSGNQPNDFESSTSSNLHANISAPATSNSPTNTNSTTNSANAQLPTMNFSNSAKMFLEDDANLGELSRISVNNSNLSLSGINDETLIDVRSLL